MVTDELRERWLAAWPRALAAWGGHLRLRPPELLDPHEVPADVRSFAWFSMTGVAAHVDLAAAARLGLAELPVEVLAHEIGHHVLSPGDLATSARLLARARVGLVDRNDLAPVVSNLWSDLLVNDRLQRRAGLAMDAVWRAIGPPAPDDVVMALVMRTDELLWSLPSGTLTGDATVPEREAQLCARAVRAYADDPVGGAAGFAALVRQLLPDAAAEAAPAVLTIVCGQREPGGAAVSGVAADASLTDPAVHPALDPKVVRVAPAADQEDTAPSPGTSDVRTPSPTPHGVDPAEYAAVLAQLGVTADRDRAAAAWYRENAAPYLVPFPTTPLPAAPDPLPGGFERWDPGEDPAAIDWPASLLAGPEPVPGFTLVRRVVETDEPAEPRREPVDLDLYVDSSGSIPDPRRFRSPLALAATVLALSALRAGARVRATTWSGHDQVAGTNGFTENVSEVLAAVVAHFGGGTSFPLARLAEAHARDDRRCHVAVISDSGVETMFARPGVAARALEEAGGGGTLVLNVPESSVARLRALAAPYEVHRVEDWDDLVEFARQFAARTWDTEGGPR